MPAKPQPLFALPAEPLLLAPRPAFRLLGVAETTGRALVKSGEIPSVELGGRKMIPLAALKRLASTVPQN